ncbi:MAG: type II secretion system protein GspM [Rhodoferax sp.]|nr:type II secretion system protein GspM [Rhodoferax sp.]
MNLTARWNQLAPREKSLLGAALAVIALALVWQLVLAPSLRTLRTATAQGLALDAQLQHMQSLQAQAKALQKQAPLAYDDALRALNQATKQTLGSTAQVSAVAERATVTLQAARADALAQWLAQARVNARSTPLEARLTRMATPAGVTWSGTLVMTLPQRP